MQAVVTKKKTKTVKLIHIDVDKCNGCRACEIICSAVHAKPMYSSSNPARARIRVIRDPLSDIYFPVYAGEYTAAECAGRNTYLIDGKSYTECALCRASCPSRDLFKEPDSGLPLKCDMCSVDPTLPEPLCVTWCLADALTYSEREEPVDPAGTLDELDLGLQALAHEHGWDALLSAAQRMTNKS